MGGRNFDCLDAVINRYKTEQIVEGHTLGHPVKRQASEDDNILPARHEEPEESAADKIYASLRECREQADPKKQKVCLLFGCRFYLHFCFLCREFKCKGIY